MRGVSCHMDRVWFGNWGLVDEAGGFKCRQLNSSVGLWSSTAPHRRAHKWNKREKGSVETEQDREDAFLFFHNTG